MKNRSKNCEDDEKTKEAEEGEREEKIGRRTRRKRRRTGKKTKQDKSTGAFKCFRTGPLLGQALQNAWYRPTCLGQARSWDRPALGTGPSKCVGQVRSWLKLAYWYRFIRVARWPMLRSAKGLIGKCRGGLKRALSQRGKRNRTSFGVTLHRGCRYSASDLTSNNRQATLLRRSLGSTKEKAREAA